MQYVETKIPVFFFQENDKFIAYSPAFDISTFGSTEEEAKRRFGEAITIFLKECADMGTLQEVLEECGWKKSIKKTIIWARSSVSSCSEELIRIPMPA